jgi:hypothetical protein
MIRRLFWLVIGAVLGVTGYRKVAAKMNAASRLFRGGDRGQEIVDFARDVRDGMRIYSSGHERPAPRLEYPGPSDNGNG